MSSQYSDNDYDKQPAEGENAESEEQLSDLTPIEGSAWTGEKVSEPSLDTDNQTVDDPSAKTSSKGTPSWVAMPEEETVEDGYVNPDLEEMDEIHEIDELDRLDDLDEIENREEVKDEKIGDSFPPIVSLSALTGLNKALLNGEETEDYRKRWSKIQGNFVDDPKATIKQADVLVSELIDEMKRKLTDELSALGSQWKQGSEITTEDLRITLQLYRSFLNRLIGKD